tara:strand:+ start:575 stop:745 length:171 start_codon:yes stop_codon:yes gene_type:complete
MIGDNKYLPSGSFSISSSKALTRLVKKQLGGKLHPDSREARRLQKRKQAKLNRKNN